MFDTQIRDPHVDGGRTWRVAASCRRGSAPPYPEAVQGNAAMTQRDHLYSLLTVVAVGSAALAAVYLETPVHGWVLVGALATWGLLSLPVGLLVGHYCALGDDPAR